MKTNQPTRWMLVEDDPQVLDLILHLVQMVSLRPVDCFLSPVAALSAFEKNPETYELVISDFDMPGMNGIQLCGCFRRISPGVKTILATGTIGLSESMAMAHGFNGLVAKPFHAKQLFDLLHSVVAAGTGFEHFHRRAA
jgi:CheY-like chemotaxis protein